jgi:uncharacterized RDD family membrane protein YckC
LLAFAVDVIPITLATAIVFFIFFDFDKTLQSYVHRSSGDIEARREFLSQRNVIRDLSFAMYVAYAALLEASAMRGTIGKRALGIIVVDQAGKRIGLGKSLLRNGAKFLSILPLNLGFLWAAWSPDKRAWHDYIAGTYVIHDRPSSGA